MPHGVGTLPLYAACHGNQFFVPPLTKLIPVAAAPPVAQMYIFIYTM